MDVRDYELMYIVRPTVAEDQVGGVTDRVGNMITGLGGEVAEVNPWGKRRLAYPIEDHEDGYYVVSQIRMAPNRTRELESQLRITDDVIRHILVRPGE
jgi:small subunit ribosomal protein S6